MRPSTDAARSSSRRTVSRAEQRGRRRQHRERRLELVREVVDHLGLGRDQLLELGVRFEQSLARGRLLEPERQDRLQHDQALEPPRFERIRRVTIERDGAEHTVGVANERHAQALTAGDARRLRRRRRSVPGAERERPRQPIAERLRPRARLRPRRLGGARVADRAPQGDRQLQPFAGRVEEEHGAGATAREVEEALEPALDQQAPIELRQQQPRGEAQEREL